MIARLQAHHGQTAWRLGWRIRSLHLRDQVWLAGLFWLAMLVVTTAISFVIDYRGEVTSSTWDDAVNGAPRWFLAIVCGYLAYTILPALIAHGRTRREAATRLLRLAVAGSIVFALLATTGFLLEKALFSVMDWNQAIASDRLYESSADVHLIFTEVVFTLLLWSAAGLAVGAGFYRSDEAGWSVVGIIWIPVIAAEALLERRESSAFSLWNLDITLPSVHPLLALLLIAAIFAGIIVAGWRLVRDIPLRSKAS
jgi:hypothetical protein